MANFKEIPINLLEANRGQLDGVPSNPRKFTQADIRRTETSILEDPEMLELRSLMVYPLDGKYIVIGGNLRLTALRNLGYNTAPCVIIPKDTPPKKIRRYILKDNVSFGAWDFDMLATDYTEYELDEYNITLPEAPTIEDYTNTVSLFGNKKDESRSNLKEAVAFYSHVKYGCITCFKTSNEGETLTEIKNDQRNIINFAIVAVRVLRQVIGLKNLKDWVLITTPKRRNKINNFATQVCKEISERVGIVFIEDAITAKDKGRIRPTFTINKTIQQTNVIVYDDIITTGSTLLATNELLNDKNVLNIVGVNNHNK